MITDIANQNAYIWDLDGTLLDSYFEIDDSVQKALHDYSILKSTEEINRGVIFTSVSKYLGTVAADAGISFEDLNAAFQKYHAIESPHVQAMPGAEDILQLIQARGDLNFVFTHRGKNAFEILGRTGLLSYFKEILLADDGFARKPAPDAVIYLMEKYRLIKKHTFYIGDRTLDMQCAANAGIYGILFKPETNVAVPDGNEEFIVSALADIASIT